MINKQESPPPCGQWCSSCAHMCYPTEDTYWRNLASLEAGRITTTDLPEAIPHLASFFCVWPELPLAGEMGTKIFNEFVGLPTHYRSKGAKGGRPLTLKDSGLSHHQFHFTKDFFFSCSCWAFLLGCCKIHKTQTVLGYKKARGHRLACASGGGLWTRISTNFSAPAAQVCSGQPLQY